MLNLAVVGGRDFCRPRFMINEIKQRYDLDCIKIITGDAKGADDCAVKLAKKVWHIPYEKLKADWDLYGKDAGFIRNAEIEERADECIAFWDGQSPGTRHTIDLFKESCKAVVIIKYV